MSIEEQDQILGRLTRLSGESWRKLNAIGIKLHGYGTELAAISKKLNSRDLCGPDALKETITAATLAVQGLPDRQLLLDSLAELQAEIERHGELSFQLHNLASPEKP